MSFDQSKFNTHHHFITQVQFSKLVGLMSGVADVANAKFVMIRYPSNGIIKRETKAYLVDGIALASNIGGGLGLALGISMFSLLDYVTQIFLDKINIP